MIIRKLLLENIRSYKTEKIDFPEGIVLLAGDIGSGKSSILLAIEFALFGTRRTELTGAALLRHGESTGFVELEFEIEKKAVCIRRTLKRQAHDIAQGPGHIIIDGIMTEATPVELKARIIELLGYPKELITKSKSLLYRYTVYTPQEEIKQILMEDKDYRLDTLRKVFGIDRYKTIRENAVIVIRRLREKLSRYEEGYADMEQLIMENRERGQQSIVLAKNAEERSVSLNGVKRELQDNEASLLSLETQITKLNRWKSELGVSSAKLREKQLNHERITAEASQLDMQLAELYGRLQKHASEEFDSEELLQKEKELEEAVKKQAAMKALQRSLQERLGELDRQLVSKTAMIAAAAEKKGIFAELARQTAKKQEIAASREQLEQQLIKLSTMLREHEVHAANSQSMKMKILKINNCPTCLQHVSKEHKDRIIAKENIAIAEHQDKISLHKARQQESVLQLNAAKALLEQIAKNEKRMEFLRAELGSVDADTAECGSIRAMIKNLSGELQLIGPLEENTVALLHEKVRALRLKGLQAKEKEHLKASVDDRSSRKIMLIRQKEVLALEIAQLESEKKQLGSMIAAYLGKEEQYRDARLAREELKNREKEIELSKAAADIELKGLLSAIDAVQRQIADRQLLKDKASFCAEVQHWMEEHIISLTESMERKVMLKAYYEFNGLFVRWFSVLMEDQMLTVRLDENFTPVIEQNGYETSVTNLSGGEKTAAALSYRLALNKAINQVMARMKTNDLIILDEPTEGFSAEQLDKLREVLSQLNMRQVIIVSHENKIESFADTVIKIQKQEHRSAVVA